MTGIQVGNFNYTQDDLGNWIYKAQDPVPVKKMVKYKERPEYKLNEQIEGKSKQRYQKVLNKMVVEIVKTIKESK